MFPSANAMATALSVVVFLLGSCDATRRIVQQQAKGDRIGKFLSPFQIVTFPNNVCSGGSKNGTCYSAAECSSLGGMNDGSCANGFGVCCTFTINCGASSNQNCTYFDSNSVVAGGCSAEICPCNNNICQLRLDFASFMIAGPSTETASVVKTDNGAPDNAGVGQSAQTQCLTDTFTVTNPNGAAPPTICGVNAGEHMYVDSSSACNDLVFQLGSAGVGTSIPNRSWSIKATQYACDFQNLAPQGCTQYFFGPNTDTIQSFNYNNGNGQQLANQQQSICVRREATNCRICYFTSAPTDFNISGKTATTSLTAGCCAYTANVEGIKGFDCVQIPNAEKTGGTILKNSDFCGNQGLKTQGAQGQSVCSTTTPFRLNYLTDNWEGASAATSESFEDDPGFMLTYVMDSINC